MIRALVLALGRRPRATIIADRVTHSSATSSPARQVNYAGSSTGGPRRTRAMVGVAS